MNIVEKPLNELKPYEKNPRKNNDAVKYVAESIKQFGFKVPIVIDKDNVIVAGHTRYLASIKLGLESVPCIVADDLTPKQIKAYRLADNKVSEKSEWDIDLLNEELGDLLEDFQMIDFGFDQIFEENEVELEIPKEEKEDAEAVETQVFLKWEKTMIPLSEEELQMLNDALARYTEEYGTVYGFVRGLLKA